MLNAIIFDFDGVVVDSEPLHYQAFTMVGKSFGFEFGWDEYMAQFIGFDDRDAFKHMLVQVIKAGGSPEIEDVEATIATLCDQKRVAFETLAAAGTAAVPGTVELIDEAYDAGLPIAIASGATRADIEQMLGLLKRRDCFEVIVAADDVAVSKPDPATYAQAFDQLSALHPDAGLSPETTLAIEDTRAGLASALGAGLQTLALMTTSDESALIEAGANKVIPDLSGVSLNDIKEWFAA